MIFLGLLEEELGSLLVETRHGLGWQVGVLSHDEGTKEGVNKILVLLIEKLVHDEWHARGRVLNLAHHRNKLANDYSAVNLALHLAKSLLEDLHGGILHGEVAKAPVIAVKQHGCGHFLSVHGRNCGDLLRVNLDILNFLDKFALVAVEADVDTLLTEDSISILAVALSDLERSVVAISLLKFSGVLVDTLRL